MVSSNKTTMIFTFLLIFAITFFLGRNITFAWVEASVVLITFGMIIFHFICIPELKELRFNKKEKINTIKNQCSTLDKNFKEVSHDYFKKQAMYYTFMILGIVIFYLSFIFYVNNYIEVTISIFTSFLSKLGITWFNATIVYINIFAIYMLFSSIIITFLTIGLTKLDEMMNKIITDNYKDIFINNYKAGANIINKLTGQPINEEIINDFIKVDFIKGIDLIDNYQYKDNLYTAFRIHYDWILSSFSSKYKANKTFLISK